MLLLLSEAMFQPQKTVNKRDKQHTHKRQQIPMPSETKSTVEKHKMSIGCKFLTGGPIKSDIIHMQAEKHLNIKPEHVQEIQVQ